MSVLNEVVLELMKAGLVHPIHLVPQVDSWKNAMDDTPQKARRGHETTSLPLLPSPLTGT